VPRRAATAAKVNGSCTPTSTSSELI
jgi:hypothetical protein